jgi:hypothetical protein
VGTFEGKPWANTNIQKVPQNKKITAPVFPPNNEDEQQQQKYGEDATRERHDYTTLHYTVGLGRYLLMAYCRMQGDGVLMTGRLTTGRWRVPFLRSPTPTV